MRRVVVALAVLAIAGCGGDSQTSQPAATASATTERGAVENRVAGTTLDGKRVSLDQFRGRPVLVNVWSSW